MNITDYIKKYDADNMYQVLKDSHKQIEFAWSNNFDLSSLKNSKISQIIVSGMGGSAIAGNFAKNFLRDELKVPLIVNRNYSLPASADENTLVILSSYSGETEETLSTFEDAIKKQCKVICVTTGGTLQLVARAKSFPVVSLMEGFQPRFAFAVSFFTLLRILQTLGLIDDQTEIVNKIIENWKDRSERLSSDSSEAIKLAEKVMGFVPVILSAADYTDSVGLRFKGQFNENSKMAAFCNSLPEQNHNEIVPWEYHNNEQNPFIVIALMDNSYHPRIKKRFEIITELIRKSGVEVIEIKSRSESFKERLCNLLYCTDWLTYYCALFQGRNPKEINYIHHLKNNLSK